MAKPRKAVFATNFDTVHRLACFKRDVLGDMSDFSKYNESTLADAVQQQCQECTLSRVLNSWWAPDTVILFDDGLVQAVVRTCEMDENDDETKMRFVRIKFGFCKPEDVSSIVEQEKKSLNYWFVP